MKRLLGLSSACCILVAAAAFSTSWRDGAAPAVRDLRVDVEEKNPWTHLRLNNDPREFRFAVISDRTGGHRPKIFSQAVERLNLLQPEFVLSVGDLIEGYTEDKEKLAKQWQEFNDYVGKLQMPFFYVPGNHDLSNPVQVKEWSRALGRRYYHFVYRDVLFLILDSEDPPPVKGKEKDAVRISEAQVAYVKKTLEANRDVRWTIVSIHKPLWSMVENDKSRWLDVEKLLAGRSYTVFAGHVHRYQKYVRQGMNYYQLATTGGGSKLRGERYGEFDHFAWVTMKKDGPILANVMLDGIVGENLKISDSDEEGVPTKNRKKTYPCVGKLTFQGQPVAGAVITLWTYGATSKKWTRVSDAWAESDGTFRMSTYAAFDGAPAGDFALTATWREPQYDAEGKLTPNKLPARYATAENTPLKATVKEEGKNELIFELIK